MCHTTTTLDSRSRSRRRPRNGAVLVCVVICLSVTTVMLTSMLKTTVLAQRRLRAEGDLRQAEWLIDAGLERAVFQLARETGYEGETWHLEAEQLAGSDAGEVTIEVTRDPAASIVQLRVAADYPLKSRSPVRRSRVFNVSTNNF